MSTKYLNGVSYAKIIISDVGYRTRDTILLPLTSEMGLEEKSIEQAVEYRYRNYSRKKIVKGWDMYFTLNFSSYASKSTVSKIMALLDWEYAISNTTSMNDYRILLFPRVDVPSRYFEVIGDNKEITMRVLKGGELCNGHSGMVLRYTSKYLSNWTTRDPDLENILILMHTKHIIQ